MALQEGIAADEDVDKLSRRVLRQQSRINKWEIILEGLLSGKGKSEQGLQGGKKSDGRGRGRPSSRLWGDVVNKGAPT